MFLLSSLGVRAAQKVVQENPMNDRAGSSEQTVDRKTHDAIETTLNAV